MRRKSVRNTRSKNKTRDEPTAAKGISDLPAELLDQILFEVVQGEIPLEAPLDYRLVSRSFGDMSYRALAHVIEETTFDMQSQHSMDNLEAISECKKLAPWFKSLQFACAPSVDLGRKSCLAQFYDCPAEHEMLEQMQEEDRNDRYSDTWPTPELIHKSTSGCLKYASRNTALESALTDWLNRFANLESIIFASDFNQPPARYASAVACPHLWEAMKRRYKRPVGHEAKARAIYAHIGLRILFSSLAASNIHLKRLDIGVELTDFHGFRTFAPQAIVAEACKHLSVLHLMNRYALPQDGGRIQKTITLTRDVFPNLAFLQVESKLDVLIDDNYDSEYSDESDNDDDVSRLGKINLPKPSDIPTLTWLSVTAQRDELEQASEFVKIYGHGAEHIDLRLPQGGKLNSMLKVLKEVRPGLLTLEHGDQDLWDSKIRYGSRPFADDKRDLQGAYDDTQDGRETSLGGEVDFGPPEFVRWLDRPQRRWSLDFAEDLDPAKGLDTWIEDWSDSPLMLLDFGEDREEWLLGEVENRSD